MSTRNPTPEQQAAIDAIPRGPITMTPVKSSRISAIGYDRATRTMALEFPTGAVYHYGNVSPQVHEDLVKADSIGHHFETVIRPNWQQYPFVRISGPTADDTAKTDPQQERATEGEQQPA